MAGFGAVLKREREKRDIALAEIARETRIRRTYLEALEREDLSDLPGTVFNKGYVKSYATYLGLDPDPLIAAYEEVERERGDAATASDTGDDRELTSKMRSAMGIERAPERGRSRTVTVTPLMLAGVAAVVVLLLVGGWYALWGRGGDGGEVPEATASRRMGSLELPADSGSGESASAWERAANRSGRAGDGGAMGAAAGDAAAPEREMPAREQAPPAERPQPVEAQPDEPPPTPQPVEPAAAEPAPAAGPPAQQPAERPVPVEPQPAPSRADTRLSVAVSGVGTGVSGRELQGRRERFAPGQRVWFWTRVDGGRPGDRIQHVWLYQGRQMSSIELKVSAGDWRTWSYKTMGRNTTGPWAVEARDAAGHVLARQEFVCGE